MGLTDNNSTAIPRIMVFRPKLEEMKDFAKYLEYMESQGAYKAGLAKIIPPPEYKPRKNGYDDIELTIKAPIQQVVTGGQGLYQQYNIQKKSMAIKDFKKMALSSKYTTPTYFDYEDLERKYWKNVTFCPAIYGADVPGTLTDEDCMEFNINNLNTCLDMINESYGIRIMGVNTAYLYFGMWKTTFAWHTEDMDLYSINYLHFGAPKSWYCIPPEHGKRLERLANGFFPSSFKQCPAFLRHKMTLISPQVLKKYSIPFNKITQEEGEFMITFPYSYHAGYNHGYNCAESTNFALPRWVEFGKRAVRCDCRSDAVKISMEAFVKKFQPDRYELWLQGKDVGPDPKDPSHICAAPAPSRYEKDIMSKFNKPKRHPPHKKDFSDTEDDEDCPDFELMSPPTKAARKMFENDMESDPFGPSMAPSIASITADAMSSMPKPPTISETIHRLHQNLNSSAEKPKEKKRKKKSIETTVPPHLLNHSYAKPTESCVSSCTQPNSIHTNYEFFAQFLSNDSKVANSSQSFHSIQPKQVSNTSNTQSFAFHSPNSSPALTQSTSQLQSFPTNNSVFSPELKVFQNPLNGISIKSETNGSEVHPMAPIAPPPYIKPYYEESSANNLNPYSKPPLLKPLGQLFGQSNKNWKMESKNENKMIFNNRMNGSNKKKNLKLNDQKMVEASTSTEDLHKASVHRLTHPIANNPLTLPVASNPVGQQTSNPTSLVTSNPVSLVASNPISLVASNPVSLVASNPVSLVASHAVNHVVHPFNASPHTNRANNNSSILEELSAKTLQYTPLAFGPSPQGFTDEIKFNICMATISPNCAVCNLLRPYELNPSIKLSELETWSPPKSSHILIPSIAFTSKVKDETTLLDSRESSPLIVCMDCRICVHSVCYGVSDLLFDGSERNWRCDRCAQKDYFAVCYLCPLRGGPLKETTEKSSDKKWIHLSCALLVPDVKFVNGIAKKPIDLTDLKPSRRTDRMGCVYCRKINPENKMVDYFNGYCVQCGHCFSSFHVTCGHRNGVAYQSGDWPDPILVSCKKCSTNSETKKRQFSERDLSEVEIDLKVIARHKNSRYYSARVGHKFEVVLHHVHFVDNSFTESIKSLDILNRDCEKDPPEIGDAVEVIWNKEQLHGKYTGRHSCIMYAIMFDDGSQIKAKREDFYLLSDELPKRVKCKLSSATDRQYVLSSEDSSNSHP